MPHPRRIFDSLGGGEGGGCVVALVKVALIATLIGGVAACTDTAGEEDAPVGKRYEGERPVWVMSDDYSNISATCIGVNGVYVQRSDPAPVQVVKDDPNCAEGGILNP